MRRFEKISLEKYAWSIGTTSFRVENLRESIPQQLEVLEELNSKYSELSWDKDKQILYSRLLTEKKIFIIDKTLDKDARVKTSSLSELGLVTDDRKITNVGEYILKSFKEESLDVSKNIFNISEDSFMYLKQFLKFQTYDNFKIKPFLVLLYFCTKFPAGISLDYFKYLIPLCITKEDVLEAVECIEKNESYLSFIYKKIYESKMTLKVKEILTTYKDLTDEEKLSLFPHGKGSSYVKPILELYNQLVEYRTLNSLDEKYELLANLNFAALKQKSLTIIKKTIFGEDNIFSVTGKNKEEIVTQFEKTPLFQSRNLLFELYFLYTASSYLANLMEYNDLNIRYFKLTDIFVISDEKIELDILPKFYFSKVTDQLLDVDILNNNEYREFLEKDIDFKSIYPFLNFDISSVKTEIIKAYPQLSESNFDEKIKDIILDQKERKFRELVDKKFSREKVIKLLNAIQNNDEKFLRNYGFETNIPTILEYLVGISWFLISNKEGRLYDIFNLKLDSNSYPIRFASGGQADLIYKYSDGHDVLLEVTMSDKDGQRKLELEPVPRHLGRYKMFNNKNSYVVFIAKNLDPNVLVSFRAMKNLPYYNPYDTDKFVKGLKIIPLSLKDLINLLKENINYEALKIKFEEFYQNKETDGFIWYKNIIQNKILEKVNNKDYINGYNDGIRDGYIDSFENKEYNNQDFSEDRDFF